MTVTAGRHSAPATPRALPVRPLVGYVVGALAAGAAWVFLVRAAIDFGGRASGGRSEAWVFVGLAVFGAIGCLLLTLALLGRVLTSIGFISEYKPRRAQRR